jgi:hypothetical protein
VNLPGIIARFFILTNPMPDNIVFPVFLTLSFLSLFIGSFAGYLAYKNSHTLANEMKMILWAVIAVGCVVFGGLIWAWFLIPIILNHL